MSDDEFTRRAWEIIGKLAALLFYGLVCFGLGTATNILKLPN